MEAKKKGRTPGPDRHGTRSQYVNRGCRCDECRISNHVYWRNASRRQASRRYEQGLTYRGTPRVANSGRPIDWAGIEEANKAKKRFI